LDEIRKYNDFNGKADSNPTEGVKKKEKSRTSIRAHVDTNRVVSKKRMRLFILGVCYEKKRVK